MQELNPSSTNQAQKSKAEELLSPLLDNQRQVVSTLDRPVFVAAGAGSGKTFTLTRRIVWALSEGSGPDGNPYLNSLDEALIITFTDKAAGEIKERVRSALRLAGLKDEALKVDSAWISTIHGMCSRILRENALDLGLDPQFAMVPAEQSSQLRERAIDDALSELGDDGSLDALFDEYGAGPYNVRVNNVAKALNLLLSISGFAIEGLDSLSFISGTPDYETTLRELSDAYQDLLTFEALSNDEYEACRKSAQLLHDYVSSAPMSHTVEKADALLQNVYMPAYRSWVYKGSMQGTKAAYGLVKNALETVRAEIAYAKTNELQEPLFNLAKTVNQRLDGIKTAQSFLDNDDLLRRCAQAFREHPEIAERYTNKFKLVMIDEFQDTNGQQIDMIKNLSAAGERLTTVGDAQQSIYGFRGAEVERFEERRAEVPEESQVELDTNFRSDDAILRFVKSVCGDTEIVPHFMDLKYSPKRKNSFVDKDGNPINHPRVVVELTRSRSDAASNLRRYSADKDLRTQLCAEQLADRLARLHAAGVEPARMAVLMSSLNTSGVYIDALRKRGIESVVTGGSTFSAQEEVKTVAALLHALANPRDTETGLFPVLSSPMFSLDANDMLLLATKEQDHKKDELQGEEPLVEVPAKRGIDRGMVGELFGNRTGSGRLKFARRVMGRAWSRVGKLPIADVVLMCIRESGWLARLEAQGVVGHAIAANVLAAVRYIRELSEPQGLDAILATQSFDAWLADAKEHPAMLSGATSNAVRFMTVHASKGLEFDVVAVVGCCSTWMRTPLIVHHAEGNTIKVSLGPSSGSLPKVAEEDKTVGPPSPSASSLEWRQYLADEYAHSKELEAGRLLYVALTRAKECVILSLDAGETKRGALVPEMTGLIAGQLGISEAPLGESTFEYGGANSGLVRCCTLERQFDGDSHAVLTGDTLTDIPAILYPRDVSVGDATEAGAQEGVGTHAVVSSNAADGASVGDTQAAEGGDVTAATDTSTAGSSAAGEPKERAPFEIFNINAETQAPLAFWSVREGIYEMFSYSSAHAKLRQDTTGLTLDDILPLPQVAPLTSQEQALAQELPQDPYPPQKSKHAKLQLSELAQDDEGIEEESSDADRATNLGSAFHELARYMVETGTAPDAQRIERVAHTYEVTGRDMVRLTTALQRWEKSALRAEALSHASLRAEVPFCCKVSSRYGTKLDGAIDLLATTGTKALLIDYKTGDHDCTYAEIRESHEMQARFYAYVLGLQGFTDIECAFVCVELEDSAGQPVVTRYRFA